jgi:peptide/nickel transport system substrate-binding protein
LRFGTTSGNKLRELTQQVIQEQMKAIGIELQIQNVPSAVLFGSWDDGAARKRGTFDILMWTSNPDVDPHEHVFGYFHSSQIPSEQNKGGFNYARLKDPETDRAIEEAGSTPDQAKRAAAYRRMTERVNQELPHIVLYNRLDAQAYRKTLHGHIPNIWDNMTWNAQEWWIK